MPVVPSLDSTYEGLKRILEASVSKRQAVFGQYL